MAAPRADRARDPELASPLGGQHHEDEEDEQDPGGDRERAERREERHERAARDVGCLEGVPLRGVDVEAERRQDRLQPVDDVVGERRAGDLVAAVRDENVPHLPREAEERLRLCERQEERRVGCSRPLVAHDVANGGVERRAAAKDEHAISGPDAELLRGVVVQEDLVRSQVCERHRASGALDRPEPVQAGRIGREEGHARLGLPLDRRLDGDLLDDRRGDSVHEVGARELRLDPLDRRLVEILDARRGAEAGTEVGLGALRRDELVRLTERGDRRAANRVAHRVARGQRGRDDGRSQHQPDDDERRPAAPAAHVANAELHEDGMADREHADAADRQTERHEEHGEKRVDRDAEELSHRSVPLWVMLPRFWRAKSAAGKDAGRPRIGEYVGDRGRSLPQLCSRQKCGVCCLEGH